MPAIRSAQQIAEAWRKRDKAQTRAVELRKAGKTLRQIAAELGVSDATIFNWLAQPGRGFARWQKRQAEIRRSVELHRAGKNDVEIADSLGVSIHTVRLWRERSIDPPQRKAAS